MSERDESHSNLYLINKKLVDLNKVVSNVEYNRVSLVNEINTINDRYYDELTHIFNDHANIMQNILDELQNTRKETEEKIKNQYKGAFEMLQIQLNSIQDSFKDDLLSKLTAINSDIEKTSEIVHKYLDNFEKEITVLNKYDQEGFNNIIQNTKEKMKNELLLIDDESNSKYETLIESNQQRLKNLDDTFQKAVIDLKKKFFMTSKNQKFFEYIESFQANSAQLFSYLDMNKKQIVIMQNEHKSNISNLKMKIKAIIEDMINLDQKYQDKIKGIKTSTESKILKFNEIISQIQNTQNSESARLNERLNKFKNNSIKEIESFHAEFEKQKKIFNSTSENSQEQIEQLKNQLESDFTNLKQKYENEENDIKMKLETLFFVPEKNTDDYYFRLKELRKMHNKEVNFFDGQYQNEISEENNKFLEKKNAIQEIINLNDQIKKIKENFEIELKDFDVETENSLTEYKNQLESEKINERNKLNEENILFLSELDLRINDCNEENRQKKFNRVTELENQRLTFLTNIKHEFQTDKVIDNFISKYYDEYKKLDDEFTSFDDTLAQSKLTNSDIDKEKMKLKESEKKNSDEKANILKHWQSEISSENDRHQNFLINNKFSSDDENATKLNNEMTNIRLLYMNRFKEKENLFNELHEKLNDLQNFKIDLETPELDEEIRKLKEELIKVKKEQEEKINSEEENNKSQFYSPLLAKIKEQQNKNFQDLQIEKRKIEIEITELAKNVNDFQSHLHETIYNGNKNINREILTFQLNEQKMKNEHVKNVDDITNEFIEAKTELNKLFNSNIEDQLLQAEKKFLIVQNATITQNKKEIDKLLYNKKIIEKELNIKLKKLNTKYQQARISYNSKETRPDEQKIIDRLESILENKSQTLTSSLKDMMSYRTQLQTQEDFYNTKFGNSPKIGIATVKQRAASQMAKNLPPL